MKSEEFGEGKTITTQHAEPDRNGQIAWYDVMFEHGIERRVPTQTLEILFSEMHGNHKKKMKEETELTESHFKVGDEVICKASGMEGEVVKLDKPHGGDNEKYYTVKREDGKMIKYAPNELKKAEEDEEEKEEMKEAAGASKQKEEKFHKDLDTLVHKTFGKRKEEMKEENIDEAMFPGTKEYEKKYGQSPQQKLRKKGDTTPTSQGEMKKTDKGVMHTRKFSEMIQTYNEIGLKMIAEMKIQEEPDNEQHTQEVEKAKAKNRGEDRNDKNIAAGKVDAVKVEEETELDEREMTDAEMKKREEIVKSMKKGMQGFKDRYGERAKNVMYATAAKIAKEKA